MKSRIAFDLERAASLWAEGGSTVAIAAKLGVSPSTFSRAIEQDRGRFPRRREARPVDPKKALRKTRASLLLAQGKTVSEVADEIGIDRTNIYRWALAEPDKFGDLSGARRARKVPPRASVSSASSVDTDLSPAAEPVAERAPVFDVSVRAVDASPDRPAIGVDPVDSAAAEAPAAPPRECDARSDDVRAFRPLPGVEPLALTALVGSSCRYPVDPVSPNPVLGRSTFFCGEPRAHEKTSWCAVHLARCTRLPQMREPKRRSAITVSA